MSERLVVERKNQSAGGQTLHWSVLVAGLFFLLLLFSSGFSSASETKKRKVLIDATSERGNSADYIADGAAESRAPTPLLPVIIRVTGYGGYEGDDKKTAGKRLMAIRASRLDAYRNLAERVYGFSVSGASSVKDFMLESDSFATSVDTVVRGARVVSISDNPATGIETVVELELPGDFQRCLNKVNNFRYRSDCLRPMSSAGLSPPTNQALRRAAQQPAMQALYHLN